MNIKQRVKQMMAECAELDTVNPTVRKIVRELIENVAAEVATAKEVEIARLEAIIQTIDKRAPRADSSCKRPGITLSEAARLTLRDEGHPAFKATYE